MPVPDQRNQFLLSRSESHHRLSTHYKQLYDMVGKLGLLAISGDIQKLTDFNEIGLGPDEPSYWPTDYQGGDKGCVEIRSEEFGMLARISVQSGGFYGVSRLGGGNHDWYSHELQNTIKEVIARLKEADPAANVYRVDWVLPPQY